MQWSRVSTSTAVEPNAIGSAAPPLLLCTRVLASDLQRLVDVLGF